MSESNGVRRWTEALLKIADRPIAVIVLVLLFYLAQDAGWIPSKGRQAVELIATHAAKVDDVVRRRTEADVERDRRWTETNNTLVDILKRKAKIDQALCLAWAREPEIRRVCLEP